MGATQKQQTASPVADLLATGEKTASASKKEERTRPVDGTDRDILTSTGEKVGTMNLAHYHPRNGAPVPVLVSRIGGVTRTIDLVAAQAAASAYGLGQPQA